MQRSTPAVLCVATAAVSSLIGFAVGHRQGFAFGMGVLENEVKGVLAVHVEAASWVRAGDADRALALLDGRIDAAVVSLMSQPGQSPSLPAVRQAKLYRSVVAPGGTAAPEVLRSLEAVPVPSSEADVSPGLRNLVAGMEP